MSDADFETIRKLQEERDSAAAAKKGSRTFNPSLIRTDSIHEPLGHRAPASEPFKINAYDESTKSGALRNEQLADHLETKDLRALPRETLGTKFDPKEAEYSTNSTRNWRSWLFSSDDNDIKPKSPSVTRRSMSALRTISKDHTSGNDHKRAEYMAVLGSKRTKGRETRLRLRSKHHRKSHQE